RRTRGRRCCSKQPPPQDAPLEDTRRSPQRPSTLRSTRQRCDNPLNLSNTPAGHSAGGCAPPDCWDRWAASVTRSTTRSQRASSAPCSSSSSTASQDGRHANSSPPPSSNGSSASTTRNDGTRPLGCSAPSTTRPPTRHDQHTQPVRNNGPSSVCVLG